MQTTWYEGTSFAEVKGKTEMRRPDWGAAASLSSRSDTEMTFEIKVTQDESQQETENLVKTEQLTIGLENSVWKCRHLTLKWNVA